MFSSDFRSSNERQVEKNLLCVLHLFSDPKMQSSHSGLSQLAVIEPWTSDDESGTAFQTLTLFLGIPSLRKVVGFQMEADQFGSGFWWPWGSERWSSIREVELTMSGINDEWN